MQIYLLLNEDSDYYGNNCEILGAYSTKELAEKNESLINDYRNKAHILEQDKYAAIRKFEDLKTEYKSNNPFLLIEPTGPNPLTTKKYEKNIRQLIVEIQIDNKYASAGELTPEELEICTKNIREKQNTISNLRVILEQNKASNKILLDAFARNSEKFKIDRDNYIKELNDYALSKLTDLEKILKNLGIENFHDVCIKEIELDEFIKLDPILLNSEGSHVISYKGCNAN